MTIGKKLYFGFGAILALMLLLYAISSLTILREHGARANAASTLADVQTLESVRFQMMQNRLFLRNYLLSGDLRDEDKVNKGFTELEQLIQQGRAKSGEEVLRNALSQVEESEKNWIENFAKPLMAKRHQVDSGDATVSDLQIFYLQHDPASEVTKSTSMLDDASRTIRKNLDDSNNSAASATTISTAIGSVGTLLAIGLGLVISYYTARSITNPLQHLISVAREIGETGPLRARKSFSSPSRARLSRRP